MKVGAKLLAGCALALALSGCVERTFTVASDPAGALVYVSSVEVGRTPVTVPFTWYGDYDVVLRLQGHETLKTHYNINPPIYEIPPLDLLSAVAPWTYHDDRTVHFTLNKLTEPADEELQRRAEELRGQNLAEEK